MQFCLSWRGCSTVCFNANAMLSPTVEEELPFSTPVFFWWVGSLSNPAVPSREGLHGPLRRKDRPQGAGAVVRSFFHVSRRRPLIVFLGGAHPTVSEMNGNQFNVRFRQENSVVAFGIHLHAHVQCRPVAISHCSWSQVPTS